MRKENIESDNGVKYKGMSNKEFTGLKILEALAATGLRSCRYGKEIGVTARAGEIKVDKILANDFDPEAVKLIKKNFEYNDISCETEITEMDAIDLMYERRKL